MKQDISTAIKYLDLYSFLSKQDLDSRFRNSSLGVLWIIIQQLAFAIIAGMLWSRIFLLEPSSFIPFLTIGFALWGFISSAMTEGCSIFVSNQRYLKQLPLPQSIFIFRSLLTASFYLLVGLITATGVLIYFDKFYITGLFYMVPGIVILLGYFYGASGTMAYLGLRYKDLQHALATIFSLLFIVTPVIYPSSVLIERGIGGVVYINPFASLLEVVRYPMLNADFANIEHYAIALVFGVFLISVKLILTKKWGRFVPFWA
jgi:lipopolysaccharide transport system permease protein